eukprot:5464038-Pleurochrysis_carterae.AAC.1
MHDACCSTASIKSHLPSHSASSSSSLGGSTRTIALSRSTSPLCSSVRTSSRSLPSLAADASAVATAALMRVSCALPSASSGGGASARVSNAGSRRSAWCTSKQLRRSSSCAESTDPSHTEYAASNEAPTGSFWFPSTPKR